MSIAENFRYFFKFKQNFAQIHLMELCSGQHVLALVHRGFVFCDLPCYCCGCDFCCGGLTGGVCAGFGSVSLSLIRIGTCLTGDEPSAECTILSSAVGH